MFAAVAGTGVGHYDSHVALGDAKRLRQLTPYTEWHLSTGPDHQFAFVPFRDGRSRFKRRVRDVGNRVSGFADKVRRFEALFHRSLFRRGSLEQGLKSSDFI